MKAPVGLLSDRTVLRSKMEGLCPDKFQFAEQRKSPCIPKTDAGAFALFTSGCHTPMQKGLLHQMLCSSPFA